MAETTLRRSFARAFAASSLICALLRQNHYPCRLQYMGHKTVSSISTFVHMYSGLNKEALFSVVRSKNDRFSKKKTQH